MINSRFMRKPVLGAAMATLSGWIAMQLFSYLDHDWTPNGPGTFVAIGILIVVISSAVFVPLYLKLPRNSFFWNSWACIPLGALAGVLVFISIAENGDWWTSNPTSFYITKSLPAAIAGAAFWLVVTKTYCWFHSNSATPACTDTKLPSIWRWLFVFSITSQATFRTLFYVKETPADFYHHYDPSHHQVRAAVILWILNFTGLFLMIYTPRFFHRLGFVAILAWMFSVVACAEYFTFFFIPEFR